MTDSVITQYEYQLLEEYFESERTPSEIALTVGALSQMWVFTLYEVLRQWRDCKVDFKKWFDNGGVEDKIQQLSKGDDLNVAQNIRSHQLQEHKNSEEIRQKLNVPWDLFEPTYRVIELYRMNLAKHCAPGKKNTIPSAPGYGRVNM